MKDLFAEWLETHFPDRAEHVLSLVRQSSGGKDYDSDFSVRQTGRGPYADMLAARFKAACRRNQMMTRRYQEKLDRAHFAKPGAQQRALDFQSRESTQSV